MTALEIGGFAWEKAGQIWYKALTEKLQSNSNFQNAADLTFEAASEIFGVGSLEQNAIKTGWTEVGITVGDTGGGTTPGGEGCLKGLMQALGLSK